MKQSTKYKASHLSLYQVLSQHFVTKKILFGTCLTSTFCCILYGNFFPRFHDYNMLGHCSIDLPTYVLVTLNGSSPTKTVSVKQSTKHKVVIYSIIYNCIMFSPWVNKVHRFNRPITVVLRSDAEFRIVQLLFFFAAVPCWSVWDWDQIWIKRSQPFLKAAENQVIKSQKGTIKQSTFRWSGPSGW